MIKWNGPQRVAPLIRELLRQLFVRVFSPSALSSSLNDLQMTQFMQEHVVKKKTPDSHLPPLFAALSAEQFRILTTNQCARKGNSWGQCADADFMFAGISVPERPNSPALVIEMDSPQPIPSLPGKPVQDNHHVGLIEIVLAIAPNRRICKFDFRHHSRINPSQMLEHNG